MNYTTEEYTVIAISVLIILGIIYYLVKGGEKPKPGSKIPKVKSYNNNKNFLKHVPNLLTLLKKHREEDFKYVAQVFSVIEHIADPKELPNNTNRHIKVNQAAGSCDGYCAIVGKYANDRPYNLMFNIFHEAAHQNNKGISEWGAEQIAKRKTDALFKAI